MIIADLRHPNYYRLYQNWVKFRLTYQGGEAFRDVYLKPFSNREDHDDFFQRKQMTPVPAFAKEAVNEIRNAIFQRLRDITRQDGSNAYQAAVAGLNGGVDRRGSNMNAYLGMKVLSELLVMGQCGIFVDNTAAIGPSIKDAQASSPYLYSYCIEDILSYTCNRPEQPSEFQALLLRDRVMVYDGDTGLPTANQERIRRLWIDPTTGLVNCQFHDTDSKALGAPVELGLTRIPFVLLDIGDSLLSDVCDHQIALLNLGSSDVSYALKANYPFLVKPEDGHATGAYLKGMDNTGTATEGGQAADGADIRTGPSHGMTYPIEAANPPSFINPSSEPLTASMALQDSLKNDIRQLVNLAVMALATRASAESKSLDNQGLEAGLSYIGLVLENGERQIADFWSAYENRDAAKRQIATIKYPDRYSLKTDEDRFDEANKLSQVVSEVPSRTAKKEVAKLVVGSLLSGKMSPEIINKIVDEIDKSPYTTSNPDVIRQAKEGGLVSDATASLALGFPEGEVDQAKQDHAERVARIAAAQGVGTSDPAARGVPDLSVSHNAGSTEKNDSRNPDLQGDAAKKNTRRRQVNIEQMSVSEFNAGQGTTTPSTVTPLVAAGFGHKAYRYVKVRALATNAGSILVGPATLSASSGYPLAAGESIEIPIDSPEKVFVYATGAYGYEWLSA